MRRAGALATWSIGVTSKDWGTACPHEKWGRSSDIIGKIFESTGLVVSVEAGPSSGKDRDLPEHVKGHLDKASPDVVHDADQKYLRSTVVL